MPDLHSLLFWGFEGTIDHRISLDDAGFHELDLEPPQEDQERFVTRAELSALLERLRQTGHAPSSAPGGSPLISAVTASNWLRGQGSPAAVRFVGARPRGLSGYVKRGSRGLLSLAPVNPAIGGTLALEYRPASSKLMLSVPDGRWLDEALADRSVAAICDAVFALKPGVVGVGIGGLNKADLSAVQRLIEDVRRLPVPALIFASGSSFRRDVTGERPPDFWDRLRDVFGAVDVVSLSSTEQRQLDSHWGDGWLDHMLEETALKLAVRHSSGDANARLSSRAQAAIDDPTAVLAVARAEATRFAAQALTGLGARFDGVVSAGLLMRWHSDL
jgi:hypothetical protein